MSTTIFNFSFRKEETGVFDWFQIAINCFIIFVEQNAI